MSPPAPVPVPRPDFKVKLPPETLYEPPSVDPELIVKFFPLVVPVVSSDLIVAWFCFPKTISEPVTVKSPLMFVNEFIPLAIVTSNSPDASPSSIIKPSVLEPLCEATEIDNFPPSLLSVFDLICDLI